jgi:complement component 1 Q subcomponent-binding protein
MSLNAMNIGVRAFSGSARRFGSGSTDISLSQKLKEELSFEKESVSEEQPEFLKAFLKDNVWKINDISGNDEVTITRTFGDENIRVMFSIADVQAEEDMSELENESDSESDVDDNPAPFPVRASLSITKSTGPGALNIDLMCQEGMFVIENISFYDEVNLGTELTAEADWKRRGLYIGPQFETLDIAVQEEFEKYLQERGINASVATFIPEYAAHKEQQEYVKWLNKVNTFIEL